MTEFFGSWNNGAEETDGEEIEEMETITTTTTRTRIPSVSFELKKFKLNLDHEFYKSTVASF